MWVSLRKRTPLIDEGGGVEEWTDLPAGATEATPFGDAPVVAPAAAARAAGARPDGRSDARVSDARPSE
jgi:hypothetical protein